MKKLHLWILLLYPWMIGCSTTNTLRMKDESYIEFMGGTGATTFSVSQAGKMDDAGAAPTQIIVGGGTYTISSFSGTTTCTLSGAPNQGPVAFTIVNAASFTGVTFGTVGGAGAGKGAVTVIANYPGGSKPAVKNKAYNV